MKKKGTFLNEARKFFPQCTSKEANNLFWGATCFPFGDINKWREQLKEASQKCNRNPNQALIWADTKIMEALNGRSRI